MTAAEGRLRLSRTRRTVKRAGKYNRRGRATVPKHVQKTVGNKALPHLTRSLSRTFGHLVKARLSTAPDPITEPEVSYEEMLPRTRSALCSRGNHARCRTACALSHRRPKPTNERPALNPRSSARELLARRSLSPSSRGFFALNVLFPLLAHCRVQAKFPQSQICGMLTCGC
jgi:hypothetical protein